MSEDRVFLSSAARYPIKTPSKRTVKMFNAPFSQSANDSYHLKKLAGHSEIKSAGQLDFFNFFFAKFSDRKVRKVSAQN